MTHMYQVKAVAGTLQDHAHISCVEGVPWTATDEVRHVLKEQIDLLFDVCTGEEQVCCGCGDWYPYLYWYIQCMPLIFLSIECLCTLSICLHIMLWLYMYI